MIVQADKAKVFVNGVEIGYADSVIIEWGCPCGEESDYGCHGFRDGELFDEYLCKKCYYKKDI